jgi:hypothetical protein
VNPPLVLLSKVISGQATSLLTFYEVCHIVTRLNAVDMLKEE